MRIVFMGTPDFAVPSLRALARQHEVVAVYTRPDAVSGRGSKTRPSPVKAVTVELGLHIEQPVTLRDTTQHELLAQFAPDICVVAAYGLILPAEVLQVPSHGCVNVHGSLLPRWRGAAPVQRAILAGDTQTGVAIMRMEEGLDTGPFCVVERVDIGHKNAPELTAELATVGAEALVRALDLIERGECQWTEQDDSLATYAAKIGKHEVALSPDLAVEEVVRRVRASGPQAPARATIGGRSVTVVSVSPSSGGLSPASAGTTEEGIVLGCANGSVVVTQLKPDGKREMTAGEWLRGTRLDLDAKWTGVL